MAGGQWMLAVVAIHVIAAVAHEQDSATVLQDVNMLMEDTVTSSTPASDNIFG